MKNFASPVIWKDYVVIQELLSSMSAKEFVRETVEMETRPSTTRHLLWEVVDLIINTDLLFFFGWKILADIQNARL